MEDEAQKNNEIEAEGDKPKKKGFLPKPVRLILIFGGAAIFALAGGFGTGFLIHKMNDHPKVIEIDAATLKVDEEAIMKRYEEVKDYQELEPWEVANVGLIKFGRKEHRRFKSKGSALAMGLVTQNICSSGIRDGDHYFEESLSKSEGAMDIQTGWRMYENPEQVTELYPSKSGSITSDATRAEWDVGKKETYQNEEDFKKVVGYAVSKHLSNYNITQYTYLAADQEAPSGTPTSFSKTEDGYLLELELNVTLACEDYKVQMIHTSNLYSSPVFSFSHLSMKLDDELNLIEMVSHEKYKAAISAVISSEVESTLTTTYESDGIFPIPELNENVPYA